MISEFYPMQAGGRLVFGFRKRFLRFPAKINDERDLPAGQRYPLICGSRRGRRMSWVWPAKHMHDVAESNATIMQGRKNQFTNVGLSVHHSIACGFGSQKLDLLLMENIFLRWRSTGEEIFLMMTIHSIG
jgi:hypothetical protein